MGLKDKLATVLLLCFFLVSLVPILPMGKSQEVSGQKTSFKIGNVDQPIIPPLIFEDRKDSFWFNTSTYCIEFFKDSQGYDMLYDAKGNVQVYDIRLTLQYLDKSTWKQRGIPTSVSVQEVSKTEYKVTRYYTDYISTSWRVEYLICSQQLTKFTVILDSGQTSTYRLLWSLSGVVNTDFNEKSTQVTFESTSKTVTSQDMAEPAVVIDWIDVKNSIGSITASSISDVAQGKKLDVTFSLGEIKEGERFEIDPTLGYTTAGPSTGGFLSGNKRSNKITTPATSNIINVTSISWYGAWSAGSGDMMCGIFTHTNAAGPYNLFNETNPVTVDTTVQWWNFTFASEIHLNASTSYWITHAGDTYGNGGNNFAFYYADGTGQNYTYSTISDTDWVNVFRDPYTPAASVFADRSISLYLTYEEVSTGDSTPPTYSGLSTSTTVAGASCQFNATFTDETDLTTTGGYIFSTNNTGSWANDTWIAFSSTPETVSVSKTLKNTFADVISYNWYFNDTAGNWNSTGTQTLTTTADSYTVTLSTVNPAPSLGETITVNIAVSRATGVAVSSWQANITKTSAVWADNYAESSFSVSEDSVTTHTFNVTGLYDVDCGASVSPNCVGLTVSWSVGGGGSGGAGGDDSSGEPEPTASPSGGISDGEFQLPDLSEDDYTNLAVGVIIVCGGFVGALLIINRTPSRKVLRKQKSQLGRKKPKRKSIL